VLLRASLGTVAATGALHGLSNLCSTVCMRNQGRCTDVLARCREGMALLTSLLNASFGDRCTIPASHICCSMHPDPSKLCVLAELVIQPLATAVEEVAAGVAVEERQDARLQGLPPPMIPGVKDGSASVCYMLVRHPVTVLAIAGPCVPGVLAVLPAESAGPVLPTQEEFKPLVKDARGFEYRPERPGAPNFVQQKWGWTGLQPGVQHGLTGRLQRPLMARHRCLCCSYSTAVPCLQATGQNWRWTLSS